MEGRFAENAIQHGRFSYKTIELASICFLETRGGRFGENHRERKFAQGFNCINLQPNKINSSKTRVPPP